MKLWILLPIVAVTVAACTPRETLDSCREKHPERNFLFDLPEVGDTVESAVYDPDMTLTVTKSPAGIAGDCSGVSVQVSAMNPIGREIRWIVDPRLLTPVSE
jgi:hypothetical protein